ncbi:MAG: hypothetical protein GKS06_05450 [Acidobacteria bacterium]|nr:hypothetical protein [Acidobacteriota bacterium]
MKTAFSPFEKKWLLAAVAIALLLRLAFSLLYWVDKPFTHDEFEYRTLGHNLAAGRGMVYDDDGLEHFGRPPGYPVFLAAIFGVGGGDVAVRAVQSMVGALTILAIGALGAQAAGRRAGLVAASMAALYPPLIWMPSRVLSETLYAAIVLWGAALLWRTAEDEEPEAPDWRTFGLAGLLIGVSALVRPVALPLIVLISGWLVLRHRRTAAVSFIIAAALATVPWTVVKSVTTDGFVPIASEGGITLWTGNNDLAIGDGDMSANPAIEARNEEIRAEHVGKNPDEMDHVYRALAIDYVLQNPLDWLVLEVRKFIYTWLPIGPSYLQHSGRFLWLTWVSYVPLLLVGVAGWWWLVRNRKRQPAVLWLLILGTVAINLVFFAQERFRVPVLDPALIVGAAALVATRLGNRD